MFTIPTGTLEDIKVLAREMLKEGGRTTSLKAGDGHICDITSDPELLRSTLSKIDVDGTTVYIGELQETDAQSASPNHGG